MYPSSPRHLLCTLTLASAFLGSAAALAGPDTFAPPDHPLARMSAADAELIHPSLRVLLGRQADAAGLEASMRATTARLVETAESRPDARMTAAVVLADAFSAAEVIA